MKYTDSMNGFFKLEEFMTIIQIMLYSSKGVFFFLPQG